MGGGLAYNKKIFLIKFKMRLSSAIVAICVIAVLILYISESHIIHNEIEDYAEYTVVYRDDPKVLFNLERVTIDKYFIISGWIFLVDDPIGTYECYVALENTLSGKVYELPTAMVTRRDVCDTYSLPETYKNSGFFCKCLTQGIHLEKYDWEIILIYNNNNNNIYYHTNQFIRNGEYVV